MEGKCRHAANARRAEHLRLLYSPRDRLQDISIGELSFNGVELFDPSREALRAGNGVAQA